MSGIDRLRALAGAWDEWGLGGALAEIADEIERERAEDCYRMGFDCGTVWRVVADMERHCLGHEGMEDSPVARWARELRGALKSDASDGSEAQNPSCADPDSAADVTSEAQKVTRDPAEDVSMSAYDLLTHQRPVLDKGGVPIRVGDKVWDDYGEELVVLGLSGGLVRCRFSGEACIDSVDDDRWEPSQLTHEPPDSWERIEEDAGCTAAKYNERRGTIFTTKQQVARDLVRRCRALAERERGE